MFYVQIWFYDGSVQCYRGWHILLAIVALLSLLALGLIVPLIAAALYFKYIRRKVCILPSPPHYISHLHTLNHFFSSC